MNLNQMNEIEKMANVHEEVNKVVNKVKNDGLINDQGKVANQTTQANVENIQKVFDTQNPEGTSTKKSRSRRAAKRQAFAQIAAQQAQA